MNSNVNCKGCKASVRILDKQIREMLDDIENNGNFELASVEEYENRLMQCQKCKYLQYETTCQQCGCIVHIRARLAGGTCPYPGQAKW